MMTAVYNCHCGGNFQSFPSSHLWAHHRSERWQEHISRVLQLCSSSALQHSACSAGLQSTSHISFPSLDREFPDISWVICLSFSLSYRSKLHWQFKRREWLDHAGNGSWFNLELYSCHCCHGSPHTISNWFSSGFIGHFSVLRILIGQSLAVQ